MCLNVDFVTKPPNGLSVTQALISSERLSVPRLKVCLQELRLRGAEEASFSTPDSTKLGLNCDNWQFYPMNYG